MHPFAPKCGMRGCHMWRPDPPTPTDIGIIMLPPTIPPHYDPRSIQSTTLDSNPIKLSSVCCCDSCYCWPFHVGRSCLAIAASLILLTETALRSKF